MKIRQMMLAVMVAAVVMPGAIQAEELENPAEGAVRRVYDTDINYAGNGPGAYQRYLETFADTARSISRGGETPYSVGVDMGGQFRTVSSDGWHPEVAMWSGFLKRKNGGPYAIVIESEGGNKFPLYSLWVNGKPVVTAATGTTALTVTLEAGFNEICLVMNSIHRYGLELTIKRADSIKEPTTIGPGDLWHEDELDDEDED